MFEFETLMQNAKNIFFVVFIQIPEDLSLGITFSLFTLH